MSYKLRFKSKHIAEEFNKAYFEKSLPIVRIALVVTALLYASFAYFDKLVSVENYVSFFIIRFCIVVPLLIGIFALSYFTFFRKKWQTILMFDFVVAATGIIFMLVTLPNNLLYYGGLFLVFLAGFFFIRLRFANAIATSIVVMIIYNISMLYVANDIPLENSNLLLSNSFYLATIIIGSFSLYYIESLERNAFFQQQVLQAQQKEIEVMVTNLEQQVNERTSELAKRNTELQQEIKWKEQLELELWNSKEHYRRAKEKAEESNKLKTAFLNNISHEFRTPMNGIIGFSTLILKPDKTEEQRRNYGEMIEQSCNQLLDIVNNIIEISQIHSNTAKLKVERCNLSDIISNVVKNEQQNADRKNLVIVVDDKSIDKELWIKSDNHKISLSFRQVLNNAIKFTNKGSVKIVCEVVDELFAVSFIDTGVGIEQEELKNIFEPFRQAETGITRNFGGNGVGLSIAKSYIELLGGKIDIQTKKGSGTTVKISIPMQKVKQTHNKNSTMDDQVKDWSDTNILIVDDEDMNLMYLEEILIDLKANTFRAKNGKEAVETFQKNTSIDIVFLDLKMPVMDGYEALKRIRAIRFDVKVIAQTAYALDNDVDKIKESGFDAHLTKPIAEEDLLQLLYSLRQHSREQ